MGVTLLSRASVSQQSGAHMHEHSTNEINTILFTLAWTAHALFPRAGTTPQRPGPPAPISISIPYDMSAYLSTSQQDGCQRMGHAPALTRQPPHSRMPLEHAWSGHRTARGQATAGIAYAGPHGEAQLSPCGRDACGACVASGAYAPGAYAADPPAACGARAGLGASGSYLRGSSAAPCRCR